MIATCILPSEFANVVSAPVTPAPGVTVSPVSRVNAGQLLEQLPVHVALFAESAVKTYSVLPFSPVRNVPSGPVATATV